MWRKVLITLGILCVLSTARAKADNIGYAYCPLGEGYVFLYDSPTSFQVIANLKCGQKLTVVDPRDENRARVRTADGKEGHVQKSSLIAALPGSQPQPAAPAAAPVAPAAPSASIPSRQPRRRHNQSRSHGRSRKQKRRKRSHNHNRRHRFKRRRQPPVQSKPSAGITSACGRSVYSVFHFGDMKRMCRAWKLSADFRS